MTAPIGTIRRSNMALPLRAASASALSSVTGVRLHINSASQNVHDVADVRILGREISQVARDHHLVVQGVVGGHVAFLSVVVEGKLKRLGEKVPHFSLSYNNLREEDRKTTVSKAELCD